MSEIHDGIPHVVVQLEGHLERKKKKLFSNCITTCDFMSRVSSTLKNLSNYKSWSHPRDKSDYNYETNEDSIEQNNVIISV